MSVKTVNLKKEGKSLTATDVINFKNVDPEDKPLVNTLYGEKSVEEDKRKEVSIKKKKEKTIRKGLSDKWKKIFFIGLVVFVIVGFLSFFLVVQPLLKIRAAVNSIQSTGNSILADMESQDISKIDLYFEQMKSDLNVIDSNLSNFSFLKSIGATKGYYDNIEVVKSIVDKTSILVEDTLPDIKNVLSATGFKVDSLQTEINEEDSSLTMIMRELAMYLDLYEETEPRLLEIFDEVNKLNIKYIPNIGSFNAKSKIEKMQSVIKEYPSISTQAIDFLRYVPALVGANDPSKYLLILQNETEMRASGGLLTAYGTVSVDKGEINDIELSDMWNLGNYLGALGVDPGYYNIYGQLFLMNIGCGGYSLRAQDSGIYPDLHWSMKTFSDYYNLANRYNPANFPDYEYVVMLNSAFVERMLEIISPLEVEGIGEVTPDTLFEFIKKEVDKPELSFSADRKAIIGELANLVKEKFSDLPVTEFPDILGRFIDSVYAKDVAIYAPKSEEMQAYFEKYGLDGAFEKEFDGDYFHLNEAQNCSQKLNKWVRNTVNMDINIGENGEIQNTVSVDWENQKVYDPSLMFQYDIEGTHTYRAWVRVMTDPKTTFIGSNGARASNVFYYEPKYYVDEVMNKVVSDNVIQFNHVRLTEHDPIPTRNLTVEYKLGEELNYNEKGSYRLLVQKHPGKSWGEEYTLNINHEGKTYSISFTLDRDKVVTYRNGVIRVENFHSELDWIDKLFNI